MGGEIWKAPALDVKKVPIALYRSAETRRDADPESPEDEGPRKRVPLPPPFMARQRGTSLRD